MANILTNDAEFVYFFFLRKDYVKRVQKRILKLKQLLNEAEKQGCIELSRLAVEYEIKEYSGQYEDEAKGKE